MSISENDTLEICHRNSIADITFYDSTNFVIEGTAGYVKYFPYTLAEKLQAQKKENLKSLMVHLRPGDELQGRNSSSDWIVLIVLFTAYLFVLIGTFSRRLFHDARRFFFLQSVGDPVSRDTAGIFHWQSTIINLASFSGIALFAVIAGYYFGFIPSNFNTLASWGIATGVVITAITLRHVICTVTGSLSSNGEMFDEYIVTIYHGYRYLSVAAFTLSVFISYTRLFSEKTLLYTGFTLFSLFYLIRVLRLFLIFIKRNVSILYLILYLCALEFLPAAVIIRFLTGTF
jgi:hypothetical protein